MNSRTIIRQAQFRNLFKKLFQEGVGEGVEQGVKKTVRETARGSANALNKGLDLVSPNPGKAWRSVDGFVFDEAGRVVSIPKGMIIGSGDAIKAQSAAMAKRQQQVLSESAEKIARFFIGGAGRKVGRAKVNYQNMMSGLHYFFTQPFSHPFKKGLMASVGFGALYSSLSGRQPSGSSEYGQAVVSSTEPGEPLISQALSLISSMDKTISEPTAKAALSKITIALNTANQIQLIVDNPQSVAAYTSAIVVLEKEIFEFMEAARQIPELNNENLFVLLGNISGEINDVRGLLSQNSTINIQSSKIDVLYSYANLFEKHAFFHLAMLGAEIASTAIAGYVNKSKEVQDAKRIISQNIIPILNKQMKNGGFGSDQNNQIVNSFLNSSNIIAKEIDYMISGAQSGKVDVERAKVFTQSLSQFITSGDSVNELLNYVQGWGSNVLEGIDSFTGGFFGIDLTDRASFENNFKMVKGSLSVLNDNINNIINQASQKASNIQHDSIKSIELISQISL